MTSLNDRVLSSTRGSRRFRLADIRRWTIGEWGAILAIAFFFALLKMLGSPTDVEQQQLRAQFRLPGDIPLTKVYVNRSKTKPFPAAVESYLQFSEAEFQKYVATLDDPRVWQPVPITHGGTQFHGEYSSDALIWTPIRSSPPMSWGSLSWKQAQEARNGRVLCFALTETGAGTGVFHGERCRTGSAGKSAYVKGLIDYDTRTLHMLVAQSQR